MFNQYLNIGKLVHLDFQ